MAKHTPEPWEAEEWVDKWAIKAGKYVIASVYKDANNPSEAEANAKLIAAAPELLEACKNLLSYAEELEPNMEAELRDTHGTTSENYFIDIGKAKCAITKALG